MVTETHCGWRKPSMTSCDRLSVFLAGAASSLLLLWAFFFSTSKPDTCNCYGEKSAKSLRFYDIPVSTFYDDPNFGYTMDKPIENWDQKRREWLSLHPSFESGSEERVLIVTGSQSAPCKNPFGDHFLLRFYRNKVDYCRIHGYDIFYNNVMLHPEMPTWWGKLPAVRAAMLAHPEAEWIWWLDEDTAFTDMDFKLPLHRYKDHNFVIHGWPKEIYEKKNWLGLNAGSLLMRNCQWSLDFLDTWADMGPQSPNRQKWSEIVFAMFKHECDDQTALAYLLVQEKGSKKIHIETEYYLEGYWVQIIDTLKNISERYIGIENVVQMLRRRHAEKVSESYALLWDPFVKDAGYGERRPFVTHFAGCHPCSGEHDPKFVGRNCWESMNKALNFADNQVLRNYGFMHPDLANSSFVSPLPFDYPA